MTINITTTESFNLTINGDTVTLTRLEVGRIYKALRETLQDNIYLQEIGQQHTKTRSVFFDIRESAGIWKKPDGRVFISNLFSKNSIFDQDPPSVITLNEWEAWKIIDLIKDL